MKDIYELFNDIDIDENEFDEMEVTDLEKARVKRVLKKSVNRKKKMRGWKKNVALASIIVGLSATTMGLTFPAYAGNIPVIGDIFRFFDSGRTGPSDKPGLYDEYKEYSSEINMTKESNGITFTINDAIFDGKTVSLTYSIESNQDLGGNPYLGSTPRIKNVSALGSTEKISKVDDHHYVGILTASNLEDLKQDTLNMNWSIDSINIPDRNKKIKGNWNFELTLKATENNVKLIHKTVKQNGIQVSIEKLAISPMSFIVYYDQVFSKKVRDKWEEVYVELTIKDDLGNQYAGEGNGGKGKDSYHLSLSKTFEKIDKHATKLIVTPHIKLRNPGANNHGEVEITEGGEKDISTPKLGAGKTEIKLDDIIIDLEN